MLTDREARNQAYRAGRCIGGCGQKYAPGHTRCRTCNADHLARIQSTARTQETKGGTA